MTEHPAAAHRTTPDPRAFAVFPLRFTANPRALIDFLCVVGMAPLLTSPSDQYAELVAGGGGRVMVHSASTSATLSPAGETQLSMVVRSADAAAEQLREAGLEVTVWDEAYGRQRNIAGPHGEAIGLNEDQEDHYGYVAHDGAGADARLSVVAVRAGAVGAERDRDVEFFGAPGFVPADAGSPSYRALANPGSGGIGLHAPAEGESASRPGRDPAHPDLRIPLVHLGFTTTEDLGELAARLTASGHPARVVEGGAVRSVHVTDPDGQHLEIHPAV
ncbi:hypothetical protein [Brachybacterium sp. 107]|uniref:hypothetical protein n=1 Tax=Brachybacterium sp. 107 TaxID=3457736 RepID=UPI004033FD46